MIAAAMPPPPRRTRTAPWIGAAVLLVALAALWSLLPVAHWLAILRDWLVALGPRGLAIFAAVYVLGAVLLAPEALLTVVGGFAFGFWALPVVLAAATVGASLAFLIARYLARDTVRRLLARRRNLAAIDRAVGEDGWKIVALLRLSPLIPFNLQNYLFGATAIPFAHFAAATFFGIIPGALLYVYLGVLGSAASGGPAKWALLAVGLVATVLVAVLIARKAKAKLRQAGLAEGPQ
jgi:uncharacterized membrane protein YdjX (TVP38/TMEM64 family)